MRGNGPANRHFTFKAKERWPLGNQAEKAVSVARQKNSAVWKQKGAVKQLSVIRTEKTRCVCVCILEGIKTILIILFG
jgi:hypothetical protein